MKKTAKQNFIASVDDDHMDRIEDIADQLRLKGCETIKVLEITDVITGRVEIRVSLDALYVEGIASIEKQRIVKKTTVVLKHKKPLAVKKSTKKSGRTK